jgi:N-succinyldiaminopimelate aminotransferase
MTVSRLQNLAGIGVDRMGALADVLNDEEVLRLENLDTDLPPPPGVIEVTRRAVGLDSSNSYLPFLGTKALREAAARLVSRLSGASYDWNDSTVICAGGLNGILNVLLAILEPGDQVLMTDPIYIGLINRVRIAGGVPIYIPYQINNGVWKLERDALQRLPSPRIKVFLMMSPSMPSGAVFCREDWEAICTACQHVDAWLLYDSAMERVLFDGLEYFHPASLPGMTDRTITVGAVSKEYRMIGWRIGWIVGPPSIMNDIGLVNLSNVVCNVGIAQEGATVALNTADDDIAAAVRQWQLRRDVMLQELEGFPVIRPQGGWSMLMDTSAFASSASEFSSRLIERGRIAATAMTGWGTERSNRFIRFVFSNETPERLRGLRRRIEAAIE